MGDAVAHHPSINLTRYRFMGNPILFAILAILAIGSALGMVFSRNAVHSALWLIFNFAVVAVLYVVLNAPFIAMVQVTVYAGAIMVLFLFVIMLLAADMPLTNIPEKRGTTLLTIGLGTALIAILGYVFLSSANTMATTTAAPIDTSPHLLGFVLFETYMLPFQATGVLLLVAVIGVVVLTLRRGKNA
jgi:NADH-quinone oxidoreductase subunit J